MKIAKVLLLGGSGFLGTSVARQLVQQGIFVLVPTRRRERARHLLVLPTVDVLEADIHDPDRLQELVCGSDAVINLVGALHDEHDRHNEHGSHGGSYERAHVDLPRQVAEACVCTGTPRLVQMSALNADISGPSAYLQSRDRGESAIMEIARREISNQRPPLNVTFFRPSVIFGERDHFLNLFAKLLKWSPFIPLGSPDARFQPVWVEDVARAVVQSLSMSATFDRVYPLVGPRVYTLRELLEFVMQVTGRRRPIIGLNAGLSALQAAVFERLPGKLITRDNVRSMKIPNTSDESFPAIFGTAQAIENIVPGYLHGSHKNHFEDKAHEAGRARYDHFRHRTGGSL